MLRAAIPFSNGGTCLHTSNGALWPVMGDRRQRLASHDHDDDLQTSVHVVNTKRQGTLFGADIALPGFRYQQGLLTRDEETALLRQFETLPFKAFEFHGYFGKRRTVSFGRHYDFSQRGLLDAPAMPAFLLPVRDQAAQFSGLAPADLTHALVTEYAPGAGIGWHKDKAVFGEVIGISLGSSCMFRFRRKTGAAWRRASFLAEPRSAYLLKDEVRISWEHSIPPLESLRYSITFRTLHAG
jgi:alkylated DNA repair dioxygenase AlkB